MKTFAELETLDLVWVKVSSGWFSSTTSYQLQDHEGKVYATIQQSNWNSKVTVDAPGNRWRFDRKTYLFKPSVIVITSIGTGEQPATMRLKGHNGTLTYPDGRIYNWKSVSWLSGTKWVWLDSENSPILGIEVKGFWKQRGEVHIDPEITSDKAPPLLLFLGWYMILLHQRDAAAASVAVISAG